MSSFAVGLMSGTSMDGIDACVVELTEAPDGGKPPKLKMVGFSSQPFSPSLQDDLALLSREGTVADVCRYNILLGRMFADAAHRVVTESKLSMDQISVIGSHGQTIHHLPHPTSLHGYSISSTLQIGDPSVIANQCRVTTVGDFRVADMAMGGQGAPLVPYLDDVILRGHFEETGRLGVLLNIGGISNISALVPSQDDHGSGNQHKLLGFDCGPGNTLIDQLMRRWFSVGYDRGGEIGLSGRVSSELLKMCLEDEFIQRPPPKSTGREFYGESYIEKCLSLADNLGLSKEDTIATLSELTAAAVWRNYQLFIEPLMKQGGGAGCDLFVSGGGAKNKATMRGLREKFSGFNVTTTASVGVDPDAKEAICFALLGYQTWKGRPTNLPSVTGAREKVILGKICPVIRTNT